MTINYKNGKIYKIEPRVDHSKGDIYIGSTTKQYLSQRMTAHRGNYKAYKNGKYNKVMSYDLFDKYGIENCDIILLESVEANSKDELSAREAYYIRTVKCINKFIPLRTDQEYRLDNKEIILEKKKDYYAKNKEFSSEKNKTIKFTCDCGSEVRFDKRARHHRSIKHLDYCKTIV